MNKNPDSLTNEPIERRPAHPVSGLLPVFWLNRASIMASLHSLTGRKSSAPAIVSPVPSILNFSPLSFAMYRLPNLEPFGSFALFKGPRFFFQICLTFFRRNSQFLTVHLLTQIAKGHSLSFLSLAHDAFVCVFFDRCVFSFSPIFIAVLSFLLAVLLVFADLWPPFAPVHGSYQAPLESRRWT